MPSSCGQPTMALRQQRNLDYQPFIGDEGEFRSQLPRPPSASIDKKRLWHEGLPTYARMHYHQTLSSTRRFAGFGAYPNKVPGDALDLVLQSQYHHGRELFAGKPHIVLQPETMGRRTFRRIRNTRDLTPERVIAMGHPLKIGGIKDRVMPDSVKLMCSGPHMPQTNKGYSRQSGDGNVFNY